MAGVESPLPPLTNGRTNGALNGNGDLHDTISEPAIAFDPSVFRSYLLSLLPPILAAPSEDLESIFDDDFHDRVSRFAGEGTGVLYVVKKKDEQESESRSPCLFVHTLSVSSRGRPTHLLLQAYADAYLRPLSCHDSCNHQARSYPRSHIPFGDSTPYHEPLWQR